MPLRRHCHGTKITDVLYGICPILCGAFSPSNIRDIYYDLQNINNILLVNDIITFVLENYSAKIYIGRERESFNHSITFISMRIMLW